MALDDNDKSNLTGQANSPAQNRCHNYFSHVNSRQFLKFILVQTQMRFTQLFSKKQHTRFHNLMVTLRISNIQHFNNQQTHTTLKNVELLRHF